MKEKDVTHDMSLYDYEPKLLPDGEVFETDSPRLGSSIRLSGRNTSDTLRDERGSPKVRIVQRGTRSSLGTTCARPATGWTAFVQVWTGLSLRLLVSNP